MQLPIIKKYLDKFSKNNKNQECIIDEQKNEEYTNDVCSYNFIIQPVHLFNFSLNLKKSTFAVYIDISSHKNYIEIDTNTIVTEDFEYYFKQAGFDPIKIKKELIDFKSFPIKYRISIPIQRIKPAGCFCAYVYLNEEQFYNGLLIFDSYANRFRVQLNEKHKNKARKMYEITESILMREPKNIPKCPIDLQYTTQLDDITNKWCRICYKANLLSDYSREVKESV
ncbi:hypothetical protein [Thermobrachium celere]|uniref:Uncharacterized protein n=1 Tax=Thermobrachium celere DSM 8682 TaxID=941824 RepID=R7RQD7_9CLOT|nr:hypothetical protein [Thermobrachium celere]GFR35780.1 hypothetical protein TCEA9_15920 [Thermobrachium celere]CDF58299.1 hypothetical protein TCEL_00345 [Thermobrachium celere DSM 8682]